MPSTQMFVIFGILLRLVEGVGWAMCETANFALMPQLFPSRIATVNVSLLFYVSCLLFFVRQGIMAVGGGMGYAAGPPVGSLLFIV